jgi:hypothetical protein
MPWLGAGLPNIDSVGAGREQPLQLIVLFPVGGIHIDVQTQLACLGLVGLAEDDRGLRAAKADARRPDLYACFVAFQLDMAQYLAPELSFPRRSDGVQVIMADDPAASRSGWRAMCVDLAGPDLCRRSPACLCRPPEIRARYAPPGSASGPLPSRASPRLQYGSTCWPRWRTKARLVADGPSTTGQPVLPLAAPSARW